MMCQSICHVVDARSARRDLRPAKRLRAHSLSLTYSARRRLSLPLARPGQHRMSSCPTNSETVVNDKAFVCLTERFSHI